jgi:hypothetical protein
MSLPNITRSVCCIISPENDSNLNDIIFSLRTDAINSALKKANNSLKNELKTPELPKMVVSNFNVFSETEIIENKNSNNVRFVVHDYHSTPIGKDLCVTNSHVVEISTSNKNTATKSFFDYQFYNKNDAFIYIIVDVMLDIQMFYYHSLGKIFDTTSQKRNFSKLKVQFCKDFVIGNRFKYSSIFEQYCSFAFFCRNDDDSFDYNKYINMWNDFVKSLSQTSFNIDISKLANDIIKKHPYGAQLSYRKIKQMLSQCENGKTYELIHVYKKPKSKKTKKTISVLLGKKNLKIGFIKIVPKNQKYQYIKQKNYVDIFEFTI